MFLTPYRVSLSQKETVSSVRLSDWLCSLLGGGVGIQVSACWPQSPRLFIRKHCPPAVFSRFISTDVPSMCVGLPLIVNGAD